MCVSIYRALNVITSTDRERNKINADSWNLSQIIKMLCSVKFGLRLLLITWCVVESIGSSLEREYKKS